MPILRKCRIRQRCAHHHFRCKVNEGVVYIFQQVLCILTPLTVCRMKTKTYRSCWEIPIDKWASACVQGCVFVVHSCKCDTHLFRKFPSKWCCVRSHLSWWLSVGTDTGKYACTSGWTITISITHVYCSQVLSACTCVDCTCIVHY